MANAAAMPDEPVREHGPVLARDQLSDLGLDLHWVGFGGPAEAPGETGEVCVHGDTRDAEGIAQGCESVDRGDSHLDSYLSGGDRLLAALAPVQPQVRGEEGGMVWGVETCDYKGRSAPYWANTVVLACYRGRENEGIHLLGPLAGKVIRIAPPLVLSEAEADRSMRLMWEILSHCH